MNKMETRIRELESDEDRKNHERMQALIDQLQSKIKSYKKQIEEAEEIAALNLAKFRQAQGQLADAEECADLNEQALAKTKAKGRDAHPSWTMQSRQRTLFLRLGRTRARLRWIIRVSK